MRNLNGRQVFFSHLHIQSAYNCQVQICISGYTLAMQICCLFVLRYVTQNVTYNFYINTNCICFQMKGHLLHGAVIPYIFHVIRGEQILNQICNLKIELQSTNMLKLTYHAFCTPMTYVEMLIASQKPGIQPALNNLFAMLPLLPHRNDIINGSYMPIQGCLCCLLACFRWDSASNTYR